MSSTPELNDVASGVLSSLDKKGLLDDKVKQIIVSTCEEPNAVSTQYVNQGDFTIALIQSNTGKVLGAGVSKRNHVDKWNGMRGRATALSRAVRNWVQLVQLHQS